MSSRSPVELTHLDDVRQAVAQEVDARLADLNGRINRLSRHIEDAARLAQGTYTAEQVARIYLGGKRTPQTVKRWCQEEGLPHTRHHGLWIIDREDLEEWLATYSK